MIIRSLIQILIKFLGDDFMMVLLFTQRVINGKTAFEDVPRLLKQGVYEELKDSGLEYLAGDYQPPEAP